MSIGLFRRGPFCGAFWIAATFTLSALQPIARATIVTYAINANGIKEVSAGGTPGQGDLDGSATGTLTLNNGTGSGTTGSATFSLTFSNIDLTTLSGHHIHQAAATATGGI